MKVYVASPLKKKAGARYAAERLRNAGIEVGSTWHATEDTEDPSGELVAMRRAIFEKNKADLLACDALLVVSPSEGQTTFVEVGIAIAKDKPIHWVYGEGKTSIADADPLCAIHKSIEAAIEELKGFV